MNQKFKTLILWALPIILVIALVSISILKQRRFTEIKWNNCCTKSSAVAELVMVDSLITLIQEGLHQLIFLRLVNAVIEIDSDLDNKVQRLELTYQV